MGIIALLASVPSELGMEAKFACAHPRHTTRATISVGAAFKYEAKTLPLLVHTAVDPRPCCYWCWQQFVGGTAEPYVDFLVREHGKARGTAIPTFDAIDEIPSLVAAPAPQRSRAPAPAPALPVSAAPAARPTAPRPATRAPSAAAPRAPAPAPTLPMSAAPAPRAPVRAPAPAPAPRQAVAPAPAPRPAPSAAAPRAPAPAPALPMSAQPPRRTETRTDRSVDASRGGSGNGNDRRVSTWTRSANVSQGSARVTLGDVAGLGSVTLPTMAEKAAAAAPEAYQTYLDGLRERTDRDERMGDDFERRAIEAGIVRLSSAVSVKEIRVGNKLGVYDSFDVSYREHPAPNRFARSKRPGFRHAMSVVKLGTEHGHQTVYVGGEHAELPTEVEGVWLQSPELKPWQMDPPVAPAEADDEEDFDARWKTYAGRKLGWLVARMLAFDTQFGLIDESLTDADIVNAKFAEEMDPSEEAADVFYRLGWKWFNATRPARASTPVSSEAVESGEADVQPADEPLSSVTTIEA